MINRSASLAPQDRQGLNDAVAEVEKLTSAELVLVVAGRSAEYSRGQSGAGLAVAVATVGTAHLAYAPSTLILLSLLVLGYGLGSLLGMRLGGVLRVFVSGGQRLAAVRSAAENALADRRLRRSDRDTGLLIYASLFEGLGVVAADQRVRALLGEALVWQIEFELGEAVRRGDVVAGMARAVAAAGPVLADVLPRPATLQNDKPGDVVLR